VVITNPRGREEKKQKENRTMKETIEVLKDVRNENQALSYAMQDVEVIISNEMSSFIDFPINHVRYRKDHQTFLDILVSVGYMRQYEKEVLNEKEFRYIFCDLKDYEIAYNAFCTCLKEDESFDSYEDIDKITTPAELKNRLDEYRR
jgi:hypothetical protein